MKIRRSTLEDLPRIMELYEHARRFMAEHGNPSQWGATNWPPEPLIHSDIASGSSYVCTCADAIAATFFFRQGTDAEPGYRAIRDGAWLEGGSYGVVHRLASGGTAKGAGRFCLEWAYRQCGHLRVDTHPDNYVMQRLLEQDGFIRCGTVPVEQDGVLRLAYEKITAAAQRSVKEGSPCLPT